MKFVKEAIEETFLALLDEKPYNKITVKDIVDRCGVNRNTFYYHYQDIPSLLEEILTARIDALIGQHCRPGSLVECMSVMTEYFLKNMFRLLLFMQAKNSSSCPHCISFS